jgi:hypothetical protein
LRSAYEDSKIEAKVPLDLLRASKGEDYIEAIQRMRWVDSFAVTLTHMDGTEGYYESSQGFREF